MMILLSRLREENVSMAEKLTTLCEDSEKREGQVTCFMLNCHSNPYKKFCLSILDTR